MIGETNYFAHERLHATTERQRTKAKFIPSQYVRKVVMMNSSPVPNTEPEVARPRKNTVLPIFPCARFPTDSQYESTRRRGAQMRPTTTTMAGQVDEHHSFPGACSRLFFCWIQIRTQFAAGYAGLSFNRQYKLGGHTSLRSREPIPNLGLRGPNAVRQGLLPPDRLTSPLQC